MKIVVFHLPYPMGNYKLNEVLADKLTKDGHEVYLLQQLNGHPYNEEYYQQIKSLTPIFEAAMGRPVVLRYPPQAHLTKPALWKKLHQDARLNRVNKNKADGN